MMFCRFVLYILVKCFALYSYCSTKLSIAVSLTIYSLLRGEVKTLQQHSTKQPHTKEDKTHIQPPTRIRTQTYTHKYRLDPLSLTSHPHPPERDNHLTKISSFVTCSRFSLPASAEKPVPPFLIVIASSVEVDVFTETC